MKKLSCIFIAMALVAALAMNAGAVTSGQTLTSKNGMVVAANPLAAQVGAEILEKGGKAIDAAIAVSFALGVVEPYASGLGGEGYMVISKADGSKVAIDFRSAAPMGASYEALEATGKKLKVVKYSPKGYCIAGTVAGVAAAHKAGAKLPLKDLIAPAIKLAQEGFKVNATFAKVCGKGFERLTANSPGFLNDGLPWEEGDTFKNPALAKTLKILADKGTDAFYKGELADSMDAYMKKNGGWARKSDLEAYKAIVKKPVSGTYRGYNIFLPGSPVGGPRVINALNILEHFNLGAMSWDDPFAMHIMQEAMVLSAVDQRQYVGDPNTSSDIPEAGYISKQYARQRAMRISLSQASDPKLRKKELIGNPGMYNKGENYQDVMLKAAEAKLQKAAGLDSGYVVESPSTTHFSVMDKEGNAVAWTQTISSFWGTSCMLDGYFLNNEMGNFKWKYVEGSYINLKGGRRPRTTIAPCIVEKDGKVRWVLGSPGGGRIGSTVIEILVNLIDFNMDLKKAVETPKFAGYDYYKEIRMEDNYPAKTVEVLQKVFGHKVKIYDYPDLYFGGPNSIAVKADGSLYGMGTLRRLGAAAAPEK
jgi:gamma-glutamyltranspeptidase/glutathione hydrolase